MDKRKELKAEIFDKVKEYYHHIHLDNKKFTAGETKINYAGRIFDENEMINLVDSSLDFWLTAGNYSKKFEDKFAATLNVKYCSLVNSGSSANLLAFSALTSPLLKEKRIMRGDEVITVAAGFPTTIAPIIQYGAVPVFVDVNLNTLNIETSYLEKALTNKTKAVILAHTLGNPFNIKEVKSFCKNNNLWLIEDNCDALGSKYNGHYTGTFGDIGTSSFYPPHHITMGEGGAVYTNDSLLNKIMLSLRDWGRDCWCESGIDNTCKKRFNQQFGNLPFGYDHKYVYSHFGYNLKATDMQAAIGFAQLDKLSLFCNKRRNNYRELYKELIELNQYFDFFEKTPNSDPSWFGFLLTVKDNAGFSRADIVNYLEDNMIQTRNLFGGNLVRQPCFDSLKEGIDYKVIGDLINTDIIMNNSFWIGVYPGMTNDMLNYIIRKIKDFVYKFN